MSAPLQGCSMGEVRVWWPAVVTIMMIGVAKIAVAAPEPVEEEGVTINTDKLFQIVDERFLSLTIDPAILLFRQEFSSGRMRIINMARGLTPAYLRLGGPDCNRYHFLRSHVNEAQYENDTITEMHWVDINHFAQEAGLKLVACLNILQRVNSVWNSNNSLDMIAFSDEMGYDVAWELGYELQELRTDIPAAQYGRDVAQLRNILDTFPRYQHSLILGPDITKFKENEHIDFLKNYFNEGSSALNGITWHPEITRQDNDSIINSENVRLAMDQLKHDREVLNSILSMAVTKKPLWIGDRQSESSQGWFLDALMWADKLGVAAQMGAQVIMRQAHLYKLSEPTPDYWVSLLHKALVGRVVLDVKQNHNNTHIHMYCHCTNHQTAGLFVEAVSYKRGAITCFGISHLKTKVTITLKLGSMEEWNDEVHQYLLTSAGDGQKSRGTLMNGQPLNLGDEGMLPILSPFIYHTGQSLSVTLQPTSIGFWVLTGVKAEPCLTTPFDSKSEASNDAIYHNIRPTKSTQVHNVFHSDQEADSHVTTKLREYGFNDTIRQYKAFSSKIMEDTRSEAEGGNFESNNTKPIVESDVTDKSESLRRKRDERERGAHGRYKRYATDSGKYLIAGLQPDYLQANNGITIRSLIRRRNNGDRLQKLPTISAHESNTHSLLHEPYHHASSEDVNKGLTGISTDRIKVDSFTRGNIYMQQGGKSSEERNIDYGYADKDEDVYEEYENAPSEIEHLYGPTEYFEVFHKSGVAANEKFAGYHGELSEAESFALMKPHDQERQQRDGNEDAYKVNQEKGLGTQEDHNAKSVTTRLLNPYYIDTNKQDSSGGEDFEVERGVTGKYKIDIMKAISNRRKAKERNHKRDYPDLSRVTENLKKGAITALGVLHNTYNNTEAPAKEAESTRSSHRIIGTATKYHITNIPSTAEEYYQFHSSISQKPFQKTVEDSYEDESESKFSKQSVQHNSKSEVHNQRTDNKTDNSANDEYNSTDDWYAQINPTKVREVVSEKTVMKANYNERKYPYQENTGNSGDANKVHESVSAVKAHTSRESVNPRYRMNPTGRRLSNHYTIEGAMERMVTSKHMPTEEQYNEESDVKYKKYSSGREVTSHESQDMPKTLDGQQEAMTRQTMAHKSRQTDQVAIRMPTNNREARHRVRRDVPPQLPTQETSTENRHVWTETENSQEKHTDSGTLYDSISAEPQMKSHNIEMNDQSQTSYKIVPVAMVTKSYEELQMDKSTKSSEGTKADHSTQTYSSLNTRNENSGNEYGKYRESIIKVNKNTQHKIGKTLTDKNHYEEHKEAGNTRRNQKFQSDVSEEYFMEPEQSKNEGNIKREVGSSVMLEPYEDITIDDNITIQAVEDAAQHQHESVLKTGSSVQEGKKEFATNLSTGETVPPILMGRNHESEHGTTQQTMTVHNQKGTTYVNRIKNTHKNQDGALITKMYQENLEPVSGVIRLPKATETHINLQLSPGKMATGHTSYNEQISNTEKYKHTKNRIMTNKERGETTVWNMGTPAKIADKSSLVSGNEKPSTVESKPTELSELHEGTATKKFPTINNVRTESLADLKNTHNRVKKANDKSFKITHATMDSKNAEQFSGDDDSDNNGLVQKVHTATPELKAKSGEEQEHSVLSTEKALRSMTDFMDDKFRTASNKRETDISHSKLEDIITNDISYNKNVADPLVRNAKDIGHLKHIAARRENLNLHGLNKANDHTRIHLSTLTKMNEMRTRLEKKRLEILHALTAQRAKLREDFLKIRVMGAGGRLRLPHHVSRRDTTQNELRESVMFSDEPETHAPICNQNESQNDCGNEDNPSIELQDFEETEGDSSSYTDQSNDKYHSQDIHKQIEQMFLPVSIITDVSDIQVPVFDSQQVYKTSHYSESEILPRNYVSGSKHVRLPKQEDQSLVQQSKTFSSGAVPFSAVNDMGPKTMYAKGLFPGWHREEPHKENVPQISSINSSPNQTVAEDQSAEREHIEMKRLSLPLIFPRPVHNVPMTVQSQRMPTSENEITFFPDSEPDEADTNDTSLTREERHISSLLPTMSDSVYSENDQSLHNNRLEDSEPRILRSSETTKDINKHSDICISCDEDTNSFIFQPLTQDLGNNYELILGLDNPNTVPIRSERAISYTSNDNLLKPSTMASNKNPRIADNKNGKYWLQNFLMNNSTHLEHKSKTEEINSNMHHNVIMPVSNELITSNVVPDSNVLKRRQKLKFNSEDIIPANIIYVTDIKLIPDYQLKYSENVSDEKILANHTFLGSSGNFLNGIMNAAAHGEKHNEMKDALKEMSNEVNLQTNEINTQFKTTDSFLKSEHENNINKAENDVETKIMPYEFHKHVFNSINEPTFNKIRKYSKAHKHKLSSESNEQFPSIVTKIHNKSSPDETSNATKKILSISFEEFSNINNKSKLSLEPTASRNSTPMTAIEYSDISKVPFDNGVTNRNSDIFIELNVKNQDNGSFLILQTHPQDDLNNLNGSTKSVTTFEKLHNAEIVPNTEEDSEYSDTVNRNNEHEKTSQREKKPTSITGNFHTFIKNISDHIVKFFHKIPPWNYFSL